MTDPTPTQNSLARARFLAVVMMAVTLAILGGIIFLARVQLRTKIREQLAGRDAQILAALSQQQLAAFASTTATDLSEEPSEQLAAILETSRLPQLEGMIGTRLFTPDGKMLIAFPADIIDTNLAPQSLGQLKQMKPLSRFHEAARLGDHSVLHPISNQENARQPLLEVLVPLSSSDGQRLLGIAQFLLDGRGLAAEFAVLDRNLLLQSLAAFLGGGGIILLGLGVAFRKWHRLNQLLTARTQDLLRANQELALAAKTSAIGTVSA
ncbi:MAG: hypothetical protein AB1813_16995, partial [Verrucomicrobiota bacterium]